LELVGLGQDKWAVECREGLRGTSHLARDRMQPGSRAAPPLGRASLVKRAHPALLAPDHRDNRQGWGQTHLRYRALPEQELRLANINLT
jgi:hypothetical protein